MGNLEHIRRTFFRVIKRCCVVCWRFLFNPEKPMPETETTPPQPAQVETQARRGRPFEKGNPGRKHGSKNKTTLIAASLLEGDAEQLMRTAIEIAKAGDKDMLKFLLSRVLPKERSVRLDLPIMEVASDAIDAVATVTRAVSVG